MIETYKSIKNIIICSILIYPIFSNSLNAEPKLTPLEVSTMQTREYEITRRLAFDTVMGMYQDMGYIIEEADWETGLITASQRSRGGSAFFKINESHQASTFIRSMGEKKVKIRINVRRQAFGEKTTAGNVASHGAAMGLGMLIPFGQLLPSIADGIATNVAKDDSVIQDPIVYQAIFNNLENSLFVTE